MKTCLIITGILGAIGLVVLLFCGLSGWFVFSTIREAEQETRARIEERKAELEEARRPPDSPGSIDQAIEYLNRSEDKYHLVAAQWLAAQPANRAYQSRVNKALVPLLKSSPQATQQETLKALALWGDASVAGDVALTLRPNNAMNRQKLGLLAKWKQKIGADKVADLLSSPTDASTAADTLSAIGPDAAPYVAAQLSKGGATTEHAQKMLEGWGMDTSKALIQLYAEKLRTDNLTERRKAMEELKSLPFDDTLQDIVVEAIVDSKVDGYELREMMSVIEKWGDQRCLPMLHAFIREQTFGFEEALSVAAKIGDPSSIPVITEVLPRHSPNNEQIINAFLEFGEPVSSEVLRYANHENETARKRARAIVQRLDTPSEKVLNQCVLDLNSTDDSRVKAAIDWLDSLEVDKENQIDVAAALGKAVDKVGAFEKRQLAKVLGNWATGDQMEALIVLMDDYDKEVWLTAFECALKLDEAEKMKFATAELFDNFGKRQAAYEAMVRCGQPCEELAILMLNHNDVKVVEQMVTLLGNIGTQPSVEALGRVSRAAQKLRAKAMEDHADDAKRAVLARLKAAEEESKGQDDGG